MSTQVTVEQNKDVHENNAEGHFNLLDTQIFLVIISHLVTFVLGISRNILQDLKD